MSAARPGVTILRYWFARSRLVGWVSAACLSGMWWPRLARSLAGWPCLIPVARRWSRSATPRPVRGPSWTRVPALVLLPLTVLFGATGLAAEHGTAAAADGAYQTARTTRFSWPIAPPHPVLRPFQRPATDFGPGHRGVDLGGSVGEAVLSAGDGLVLYAGPLYDRSLVSVEHADGLRTTYEPISPVVRVGQYVARGQLIGYLMPGHPGCPLPPRSGPAAACLHWGVHRDRVYLDPLRLVEIGRIRLLPWPPGES